MHRRGRGGPRHPRRGNSFRGRGAPLNKFVSEFQQGPNYRSNHPLESQYYPNDGNAMYDQPTYISKGKVNVNGNFNGSNEGDFNGGGVSTSSDTQTIGLDYPVHHNSNSNSNSKGYTYTPQYGGEPEYKRRDTGNNRNTGYYQQKQKESIAFKNPKNSQLLNQQTNNIGNLNTELARHSKVTTESNSSIKKNDDSFSDMKAANANAKANAQANLPSTEKHGTSRDVQPYTRKNSISQLSKLVSTTGTLKETGKSTIFEKDPKVKPSVLDIKAETRTETKDSSPQSSIEKPISNEKLPISTPFDTATTSNSHINHSSSNPAEITFKPTAQAKKKLEKAIRKDSNNMIMKGTNNMNVRTDIKLPAGPASLSMPSSSVADKSILPDSVVDADCFFLPPDVCDYLGTTLLAINERKHSKVSVLDRFSIYESPKSRSKKQLNIFKFTHTCTKTLSPNMELYAFPTYSQITSTRRYTFNWYSDILPLYESENGSVSSHRISKLPSAVLHDKMFQLSYFDDINSRLNSVTSLHYDWSRLILTTVYHGTLSKFTSNMLIIDRDLVDNQYLLNDLKTLLDIGIDFDYVLDFKDHDMLTDEKHMIKLLDEIYNKRHPWAQFITEVNVFDWEAHKIKPLPSNQHKKFRNDFSFNHIKTSKLCRYFSRPQNEIQYLFKAFENSSVQLQNSLSVSYLATSLRLSIDSIKKLKDYLYEVKFYPRRGDQKDFFFNFKDILICYNKLSYQKMSLIDRNQPYNLSIMKYGHYNNELYAIEFLVSPEVPFWLYEKPVLIFARHKSVSRNLVKSQLKKMDWTFSDFDVGLQAKFFADSKIKIVQGL